MAKKNNIIINSILAVLVAVGSWAVFSLARLGITNFLERNFGITSEGWILFIIIMITLIVLALVYGIRQAIIKITGK